MNIEQSKREAKTKNNLAINGMIPILQDGKLCIYKVTVTDAKKILEIAKRCKEEMFTTYSVLALNNFQFQQNIGGGTLTEFFEDINGMRRSYRDMYTYHKSTADELFNAFHLDYKDNKEEFIKYNEQEIEDHEYIDEKRYQKIYRKETFEEIVERLANDYVTCVYKRESKLSKILPYFANGYFRLDLICELACNWLYQMNLDLGVHDGWTVGSLVSKNTLYYACSMGFNDKEINLSEEEKISLIKTIINTCELTCIYCEDINSITKLPLKISKRFIIKYATENTSILENPIFSNILSKVSSEKCKILKKEN